VTSVATFSNVGAAPLTINAVNLPSAPFNATGVPAVGSTIPAGSSVTVNVTFEPTAVGSFSSELGLETTGGNAAVGLTGSAGLPGLLKITSEQNNLGEVEVGKTATRSFTVTNTGGTSITITKSKPPLGGAFAATTSLAEGSAIAPGESVTETVAFSPTTPGPASGVWLINGSDASGLHEVSFSGTGTASFGKTSVGASSDAFVAERKRVNRYGLPTSASVTKLNVYLAPTGTAGQQVLKGVVYADANGAPGALLGVSEQLTFASTNAAGWYQFAFSNPLKLAAGNYWMGVMTGPTAHVAGFRYDTVAASRDWNANTYASGPSNPFGAVTTDGEQASVYASYTPSTPSTSPPVNTSPPTITGTTQQGKTLTEHHGSWTNEPTSYSYQWLQCESLGGSCLPIAGATSQTYVATAADVGHTLKVEEIASNAGGPGSPATSPATAQVEPPPIPVNISAPTIVGTAQQGQALTAQNGSWSNEPTSFAYQWQRCDTTGSNCSAIPEATAQTYTLKTADVGATVRVAVSASNLGGASSQVSSVQTAVVTAATSTFGKTSVGASSDVFASDRKRVSRYALPTAGSVTKLSIYLAPTGTSGQQALRGVVYADANGAPGALLGVSEALTFSSTNAAGWYQAAFSTPVKLAAGNYWIGVITGATAKVAGFRYDSVAGSRDWNANPYASGATNPFGAVTTDGEQTSLYASYTPG
jgi:hypothetical protein